MAYNVDVDMFAKAMSYGLKDGMALGSTFSNFSNALIKGFDDQQKYDSEEQAQAIRQNTIEQQPVQNRINEAQAVAQEAKVALIKSDPEAYLKNQQLQMDAENAKNQQVVELDRQQTEFQQVISSGDGAAQADAILSGKYNLLFSQNKELRQQTVGATVGNWPEEAQKQYQQQKQAENTQKHLAALQEDAAASYPKLRQQLLDNGEVNAIASKLGTDPLTLASRGSIQKILVAPLIQKTVEGDLPADAYGNKKRGQVPVIENGEPVYIRDPNAAKEDKQYKHVLILDGEATTHEFDASSATLFNNTRVAQKIMNGDMAGMSNGDNSDDIQKQIKVAKARKDAEAAAKNVQVDPNEVQSNMESFYSGATPAYQTAASKVQAEAAAQLNAKQYKNMGTPAATKGRDVLGQLDAPQVTWGARSGVETGASALSKIQMAGAGSPDSMVGKMAARGTSMGVFSASDEVRATAIGQTSQAQTQIDALRQSKADVFMKARNVSPNNPKGPPPADSANAPLVVPPGVEATIPQMTTMTTAAPKTEAIARVAALPETQGMSAVVKAVIVQESAGKLGAVSPTGVKGYAQVTKDTAEEMVPGADRADGRQSVLLGAIRLQKMMDMPEFENNPLIAITSYNAGPATMIEAIKAANGSTDWNDLKRVIPSVVTRMAEAGAYGDKVKRNPSQKVKEVLGYADSVLANFPAFVATTRDMELARQLEALNILKLG